MLLTRNARPRRHARALRTLDVPLLANTRRWGYMRAALLALACAIASICAAAGVRAGDGAAQTSTR